MFDLKGFEKIDHTGVVCTKDRINNAATITENGLILHKTLRDKVPATITRMSIYKSNSEPFLILVFSRDGDLKIRKTGGIAKHLANEMIATVGRFPVTHKVNRTTFLLSKPKDNEDQEKSGVGEDAGVRERVRELRAELDKLSGKLDEIINELGGSER
jgi:hypothetical protein